MAQQVFGIPSPSKWDDAVGRKKRQLVKYIKGRGGVGKDAPIRGTRPQPKPPRR